MSKSIADDIIGAVESVTKKWTKQRRAEERHASATENRNERMMRRRRYTLREAAFDVMEAAYIKASSNGTLPANARQIMYAARPEIQRRTGQQLNSQYFTQTLLPDFMNEYEPDWDVVFDDRGHFREPHSDSSFGLGTLNVRRYIGDIGELAFKEPSFSYGDLEHHGPDGCYGAILFVEKEGFLPLFDAVGLAERLDIAIMSTKGVSVTAARHLIDEICGDHDIPLLVLRDFDKSGFSIIGTLRRDTRRYKFTNDVKVVDLGLRIEDIDGLQSERAFDKGRRDNRISNLRENGATNAEIQFLLENRVELNAMTSEQLVAFVERKLTEHGVKKILPDKETLAEAYQQFERGEHVSKLIEEELKKSADVTVPADLETAVNEILVKDPKIRWTDAVKQIVQKAIGGQP